MAISILINSSRLFYILVANIRHVVRYASWEIYAREEKDACRACAVTITGTTARGIGFLATIFGRQAVGKAHETVSNARESSRGGICRNEGHNAIEETR